MAQDKVIQETEKFFLDQGFEETSLRGYEGEKIFKYKNSGYYMISRGEKSGYYLEDAETFEEAQNKVFEDMAHFDIAFNSPEIIDEIKAEITEYVINKTQSIPGLNGSEVELAVKLWRERATLEKIAGEISKPVDIVRASLFRCGFSEPELIQSNL